MFEKKLRDLMAQIGRAVSEPTPDAALPADACFLEDGSVLCRPRKSGVSRYPYSADGLNLWAYSSGILHAIEGTVNVLRPVHHENESPIQFFGGLPLEDGTFFPVPVLGGGKPTYTPFPIAYYLVYSLSAAYYIADTEKATFVLRLDVSRQKEMRFSFGCLNKTGAPLSVTYTGYMEGLLRTNVADDMWSAYGRQGRCVGEDGFLLRRRPPDYHAIGIRRAVSGAEVGAIYRTASRPDYLVYQDRGIANAECLRTGKMEVQHELGIKLATPIAAEILHLTVPADGFARVDNVCRVSHDPGKEDTLCDFAVDPAEVDASIAAFQKEEEARLSRLTMTFGPIADGKVNHRVLNRFLLCLQKQVDFCAMGKNYVEDRIGIRDVFQQLEQAMLWDPAQAREKILRAIGYIDVSGRAPRQFSIVPNRACSPKRMDLDAYIDQGNWILSTLYSYLALTGDTSLLDETAWYFEIVDEKKNQIRFSEQEDSVVMHLLRVTDYLLSNIDEETGCLRALKGDWNDAIDGLGATTDPDKKFGTGVSVMASLHLSQNLKEMADVLDFVGRFPEKAAAYRARREQLRDALNRWAKETDDKGEVRLIHGWGDHRSYLVGSHCDSDGVDRISFAPYAFWATSGMVERDPALKEVIRRDLMKLDSPYGLMTNYPPFTEASKGVGRIVRTLPGSAENACAYTHASMFSVAALFRIGAFREAWEGLEKTLTIAQKSPSKTPFVMSNSYCRNLEEGLDGQSAIDWYTGTGTVMIKNFVRGVFGLTPTLEGLRVAPTAAMPTDEAAITLPVRGKTVRLTYRNTGAGKRAFLVDGKSAAADCDALSGLPFLFLPADQLRDGMEITVTD